MSAGLSQHKDWKVCLIFNLALAMLAPSNADAQNAGISRSINETAAAGAKSKNDIKVVEGKYYIERKKGNYKEKKDKLSPKETEQIKENIARTGMDIRYNKKRDFFTLRKDGTHNLYSAKHVNDLRVRQWQDWHDSLYSNPPKITKEYIPIKDYLSTLKGVFYNGCDSIVIRIPTQENKAEAVRAIMKTQNLSLAEADSVINEIFELGTNETYIKYIEEHEKSHVEDYAKGIFKPDISCKRFAQLEMLTEVKATMSMAGLALQYYKETGDLSHFAYINGKLDAPKLQNDLRDGKAGSNPELYVAKFIFDEWLGKYNKSGTEYSEQAKELTILNADKDITQNIGDSPVVYQEYLRRVNLMFSDVKGLGDVTQAINSDFELNPQLQKWAEDEEKGGFSDMMSHGSVQEDINRIKDFLLVIRDLDQGKKRRTPETQAAIDKAIENLKQPKTFDMTQLMNLNVRTK